MTFASTSRWIVVSAASLIAGSCLALGALSAQQSADEWTTVAPGQRVRITTLGALGPTLQAGQVLSVQADTIVLRSDDRTESVAVPRFAITDMEVSRGQHRSTSTGIVIGVLGGGAAGAIAVAATTSKPKPCPTDLIDGLACAVGEGLGPSTGQGELIVGVLGAIVGGAVGGLVGHAHESEDWASVPLARRASLLRMLPSGLDITPTARGVAVAFDLRF